MTFEKSARSITTDGICAVVLFIVLGEKCNKLRIGRRQITIAKERNIYFRSLVQTLGWAHGALDVQRANILPVLLEQRHQKVDSQVNVLNQLILIHLDMADGNAQAQDLKREESSVRAFEDGISEYYCLNTEGIDPTSSYPSR